jgi:hypothetical protein
MVNKNTYMRYFLSVIIILLGCSQPEKKAMSETEIDSASVAPTLTTADEKIVVATDSPKVEDQNPLSEKPEEGKSPAKENEEVQSNSKEPNIEISIFQNSIFPGYGYDIKVDGIPYVHQPNIPAVSGNSGFKTEEQARKVAELVKYKIKNKILPPTVELKELDSLGIK